MKLKTYNVYDPTEIANLLIFIRIWPISKNFVKPILSWTILSRSNTVRSELGSSTWLKNRTPIEPSTVKFLCSDPTINFCSEQKPLPFHPSSFIAPSKFPKRWMYLFLQRRSINCWIAICLLRIMRAYSKKPSSPYCISLESDVRSWSTCNLPQ